LEDSMPEPFAAFADPGQKRRWFGESESHQVEQLDMDFRVGGQEHLQYRFKEGTPFPGVALNNDGSYQDIVCEQRIVSASTMKIGGKRISSALITIEFLPTDKGTDLICTYQGAFFEGSDGPRMREGAGAGCSTSWKRLWPASQRRLLERGLRCPTER
jgi:uncharacterized protein YndB with AHSA1/START domain